ncbi:heavy metal translocating P-type ATPase [Chloroflexi bacterium TSY]|nr:heavy metal translocating P-type ATPase [Chloroflexi bacterium TSY]
MAFIGLGEKGLVTRRRIKKRRAALWLRESKSTEKECNHALVSTPAPTIVESTFTGTESPWSSSQFTISAASTTIALIGDIFFPPLSLLSVPGGLYATRALFRDGWRMLVREGKVTVDLLVIGIHLVSLINGYFFLFCLNTFVGLCTRNLVSKVKQDSRTTYIDVFRHQTNTVWIYVDGVEIETSIESLAIKDLIVIAAGQTIPVDGTIVEGTATIDQHILTGESVPAEKEKGDTVFALTLVLAGKIIVSVEKTGEATAAAQIAQILNDTVDFKTGRQLWAEDLADQLVLPTLFLGLLVLPLNGLNSAMALVDVHPKYKTTLTTSLGILNYFNLAAKQGILIKDGRTLELLNEVDTVVFDKTGTLTIEQPHVGEIHTCAGYTIDEILQAAAAAEQHQSHPIAKAILLAAAARSLTVPAIDKSEYKMGYGLFVAFEKRQIHVGSIRFMRVEGIPIPPAMQEAQDECYHQGHSLVLVAIDGQIAGAIELHATLRPEVKSVLEGLRKRNINSFYIVSGDHEAPTRNLAEMLGIDHYFAETLPEDKAQLIEQLQNEGKVICYVGDGINDSIALKQAHVSVSLRGASTLATDTAEVILMDESLKQLCVLFDIANDFNTNMLTTMSAIFVPSLLCLGGVFFWQFGFLHTRIFNVTGLAAGVTTAMLPLVNHRKVLQEAKQLERDTLR